MDASTDQGKSTGRMVIVSYRPRPGREPQLIQAVHDHLVRAEGLATDREPIVMRALDGTILEIFEWKSKQAIQEAHSNEAVRALWGRFEEACEYGTLGNLEDQRRCLPSSGR